MIIQDSTDLCSVSLYGARYDWKSVFRYIINKITLLILFIILIHISYFPEVWNKHSKQSIWMRKSDLDRFRELKTKGFAKNFMKTYFTYKLWVTSNHNFDIIKGFKFYIKSNKPWIISFCIYKIQVFVQLVTEVLKKSVFTYYTKIQNIFFLWTYNICEISDSWIWVTCITDNCLKNVFFHPSWTFSFGWNYSNILHQREPYLLSNVT